MNTVKTLRALGACYQAIGWIEAQPDQSPQRLWNACPRADWMAWYLGKLAEHNGRWSPAHRRAVLIACLCARTASGFWCDPACEQAVALAERWAHRDDAVTRAALRDAIYAARDAVNAAIYAARDAVNAAYAVNAAVNAADAIYAANAAAFAAIYAADAIYAANAATREAHLAHLADMIRSAIPEVPS